MQQLITSVLATAILSAGALLQIAALRRARARAPVKAQRDRRKTY